MAVDWNSTYNLNNLFFKIFNPNFFQKCQKSENEYPNVFLIFLHVRLADISGITHSKLNSWIFALKTFPLSVLSSQCSLFNDSRCHTYLCLLCYEGKNLGLNLDYLFFGFTLHIQAVNKWYTQILKHFSQLLWLLFWCKPALKLMWKNPINPTKLICSRAPSPIQQFLLEALSVYINIQTKHLRRLSQRNCKTFVVIYITCYYISDLYFHFIMLYYSFTNLCTF